MRDLIAAARTFLFVPGDRPERFAKAAASGADVVILDLEDAVAPSGKFPAREHVRAWLAQGAEAAVRINAPGTPWYDDDIEMVAGRAGAVMVPKAEDPSVLESLARALPADTGVIPLIETAAGVLGAAAVCAAQAVVRPAFGSIDLAAQLGVDHSSSESLTHARASVVLAAAAAGRTAPVDGVTTVLDDETVLLADLARAASLGFTAKLCIHPRQIAAANAAFTPAAEEVAWARRITESTPDGSATVHDGRLVDRPVLLRAQGILARSLEFPERRDGRS